MRISTLLMATALAGTVSIGLAHAGTNLVLNGNFANTSPNTTMSTEFGTASGNGFTSQQLVTDWTGNNGYNIWFPSVTAASTENASGQFSYTNKEELYSVRAVPNGNTAFVGLDGDPSVQGSISQTIHNLMVGSTYTVSFDWAASQMQSRTGATTEEFGVSLGSGPTQYTPIANNPSEGFTGWFHDTMQFTATSTQEALNFLSIGTPTGYPPMGLLSGVSMEQAVPEPSSVALLGAGLVGLGLVIRRRRASKKA